MAINPNKSKQAKTEPNPGSAALLAHRKKLVAANDAVYQRQAREYQRQFKKLFSKADLRTAAEITGRIRNEWQSSRLKAGSNSESRDAGKVLARRKINRLLAAALPGFRQWQALKKAHLREHQKLAKVRLGEFSSENIHVEWGDILPTDYLAGQDFIAPFQVFDRETIDDSGLITNDQSFVAHDTGNMMNAIDFYHRDDPALIVDFFGLSRALPASASVSCGINFTMPSTGRLQISAVLQNFYSEVLYSLRDNFGFSYGTLDIRLKLFIATARGGDVVYMPTEVDFADRTSGGDDIYGAMSGLDGSIPYTVYATTEEPLAASESVQILAGSEVHIESEVNDMASHVNAVVRWQLKKITVAVV